MCSWRFWIFCSEKKGTNPLRRSLSSGATAHNSRSRVVPDSLLVSTSSRLRTDSQGHDEVCHFSFDLLGCPTRHESLRIGQPSSRVAVFTCAYVVCWIYCHWGNTRIMLGLLLAKHNRSLIVIWMNGIASQKAIWHNTTLISWEVSIWPIFLEGRLVLQCIISC